ncbi:peroxiredoxin [Apilactobacillus apisilvae]|uniref:Peroxiredoxin n=1 Tax=Apilactobacillus apisilvae TaxID=2923364 RepID=A0ABY4PIA8_9LACO|nr:peroxiredoxin [Apilactobacillus apisilvae]UQS85171.1 peroxiredoxin [Apilactobacillus apisilvae]
MQLTFLGKEVILDDKVLNVGDKLPAFNLLNSKGNKITNDDFLGKMTLISTVPDINSDVCSLETKKFNRKADKYTQLNFFTISKNTIEEQQDWCAAKGVQNMELLSDSELSFGKSTDTYVSDIDALARIVFILDENSKVVYRQIVPEIASQPDFKEVVEFIKKVTNDVDD